MVPRVLLSAFCLILAFLEPWVAQLPVLNTEQWGAQRCPFFSSPPLRPFQGNDARPSRPVGVGCSLWVGWETLGRLRVR